ncbi:DUF3152 domain-containing protein [Streptomyces sp. NBC_00289]|uniref:DUF3152 domain-containing protein n=1 Tax=Streptomyces sp. NBC_00289 TaxID=2975703 RepID=UPI003246D28D
MTAHRSKSSPARRRRRGPVHGPARGRRGPLWGGLAALTVLSAVGFAAVGWTSGGGAGKAAAGAAASDGTAAGGAGPGAHSTGRPTPTGSASAGPSPGRPTHSPSAPPSTSGDPSRPSEKDIPTSGPGTFTTASGSSAKVGKGRVLRYRVDVEDGIDLSSADVARQVEIVLGDSRGWTADGHSAFRRVSKGATDFAVRVATPATVDKICGRYGLNTGGEVNCSVEQNVMVNLKRWELATPVYAKDVRAYRALIINHEVGHFLGHGHVDCPGPGKPAPAMMQQIKGMHGCAPNVWPYDDRGRLLTGPAVS